ncbi:pyridoxal-phosphate dependent enzyme [Aquimarina sp. 2201CG14-23]|uniref:pyridoxal-phosphate dependent enzyme n=1 Tax=Aquimarina mycalae TaxID=3040073 RepID=UPI002477EC6E|nr:pyridoxal-phosphate dependent enzyme [Aquimarina sp. 2201CG14-23]MDH7448176.1 pyridoxal-phosphate dependent enzyme [Aquimarina sp. 2201CG14-23]
MITPLDIKTAYQNIKHDVYQTPMVFSPELSNISGAKVYLKMEQLQHTGSFKIRGVLNKIHHIDKKKMDTPFVAASTGNHAAAFCYASEKFGFQGTLFLPKNINESKLKALRHYKNIKKVFYGKNSVETETKASIYAKKTNGILIHPYNDAAIISGQGTIGFEIENQLPEVDAILVPIGGGGLISGIASYFKTHNKIDVIGCQPINAAEMYFSVKQGHILPPSTVETISDATAGGIEEDAITYTICKSLIKNFELSEEEPLKKAIAFMIKYHQTIIEPASALSVSTILNTKKYANQNVVLVLTGKKINTPLLTEILNTYGNCY